MICEHSNEVSPQLASAFCKMPDTWYKRVAGHLDPDTCLFIAEASALNEQAKKLTKVKGKG